MLAKKGPSKGGGKGSAATGGLLSGTNLGLILVFIGFVVILGGIALASNMGWIGGDGASAGGGASCDETLIDKSVHEHARLEVYLDSEETYDFSAERYQLATGFLHLENGQDDASNGATVHVHQARPSLGCFFETIDWQVSQDRIVTDTGDTYEENGGEITITVDGEPADVTAPLVQGSVYVVEYTPGDAGGTDGGNETGDQGTDQTAASDR